jgi:hypothetical protein
LPAHACLIFAVILAAAAAGSLPLAIYALSFWHYLLYWLAYRHGAVPLAVFKRDAVTMKTVSLGALALAYLAAPTDPLSLAVVAAGFLLNVAAARNLGADRTYYGHEVSGLPLVRATGFPYSWTPHPMLVGNIAAFGGTLINAGFREHWWPLACLHVACNLGLLAMERFVTPQRRSIRGGGMVAGAQDRIAPRVLAAALLGAAAGAGLGTWLGEGLPVFGAVGAGAAAGAYAAVMSFWYTRHATTPGRGRE